MFFFANQINFEILLFYFEIFTISVIYIFTGHLFVAPFCELSLFYFEIFIISVIFMFTGHLFVAPFCELSTYILG